MLYLASKSPRRHQLLQSLGIEFETMAVNIQEHWDGSERAEDYVVRLATEKAQAAKKQVDSGCLILASDTEVVIDDRVLGKPSEQDEAMQMLLGLSGRCHKVMTAVVLLGDKIEQRLSLNRVCFETLTEQQCRTYCETGQPFDKAGGYGIQGSAAAFIRTLEGSYSSVMGLPLTETAELLDIQASNQTKI